MAFTISQLTITDFRSYERFDLAPDPALTVLVGPNATGKTNLIEALELVTEADSFRHPVWSETVRWGTEAARVQLHACDGERRHDVEMTITAAGRRTYKVGGKVRRSVSDVAGTIPCVVFTPEDLRVVKDSAERRRALVDGVGAQLSGTYARLRTEYERVVRQRNSLLKAGSASDDDLAPWDERLVALGARLHTHRRGLFDRIIAEAERVHAAITSDGPLTATYLASWERDGIAASATDPAAALEEHLARRRDDERARGSTLCGPHRDEIVFRVAGRDARAFGSQGQQRTIALALKLAEVTVVEEVSGSRPVLLLDDVMSELDEARRHALAGAVGERAQTVMTTANLGYFTGELIGRATVVELA